jgi:hypothetical protein
MKHMSKNCTCSAIHFEAIKVSEFFASSKPIWAKAYKYYACAQCFEKTWVRSFSLPEKLPLKIHTGSSGTVYSYWVEKALPFSNWSSFSRQMPSPYVSNSWEVSRNSEGGIEGRAGTARKEKRASRRAAGQVGTGEGRPMAGRAGTGETVALCTYTYITTS